MSKFSNLSQDLIQLVKILSFFANTCMISHDYCGFQNDKKVHHEKNYCSLRGKINIEQTVGLLYTNICSKC